MPAPTRPTCENVEQIYSSSFQSRFLPKNTQLQGHYDTLETSFEALLGTIMLCSLHFGRRNSNSSMALFSACLSYSVNLSKCAEITLPLSPGHYENVRI